MRSALPELHNVKPDAPLRLDVAAALAYPCNADRGGIVYLDGRLRTRGLGDPLGDGADMFRAVGRLLDGIEHNGFPSSSEKAER